MSCAEVKEAINESGVDERLEMMALIVHLNCSNDLEYQPELDRRMFAMDRGEMVSGQKLKI